MKKNRKPDPTIRTTEDAREIPAHYVILSKHLKSFEDDENYSTLSREAYRAKAEFSPISFVKGGSHMGIFIDPTLVDSWVAKWREGVATGTSRSKRIATPSGVTREFISSEVDRLIAAFKEALS